MSTIPLSTRHFVDDELCDVIVDLAGDATRIADRLRNKALDSLAASLRDLAERLRVDRRRGSRPVPTVTEPREHVRPSRPLGDDDEDHVEHREDFAVNLPPRHVSKR